MKVELEEGDWREVEDLRVVDLRLLLGKFELSKTGTKPVLIKRLEAHLQELQAKEAIITDSKKVEEEDNESQDKELTEEKVEDTVEVQEEEKDAVEVKDEEKDADIDTKAASPTPTPLPPTTTVEGDSPLMLEADVNEFKEEVDEEERVHKESREVDPPNGSLIEKSPPPNLSPSPKCLSPQVSTEGGNEEEKRDSNEGVPSSPPTKEDNGKGLVDKSDDNEKKQSSPLKPTIPFRKLTKSVSKEERRVRPWSDSSVNSQEDPPEAVSTESLKDIIPDLKPLLETNSSLLLEEEEAEEKMDDEEGRKEATKRGLKDVEEEAEEKKSVWPQEDDAKSQENEEKEIPAASPTKRPRIDPPPETVEDDNKTAVLLIRNLVRPFTLKQLKELLERTGTIEDFWINKIKSHCFVRFSKIEEASETRKALDDVKWPSSNPKNLSVTFSTQEKMEETAAENSSFEVATVPPPKKENNLKETSKEPSPKEKEIKESGKPQLLDDLFRKTKATPCIYWTMNEKSLKKVKEDRKKIEMAS